MIILISDKYLYIFCLPQETRTLFAFSHKTSIQNTIHCQKIKFWSHLRPSRNYRAKILIGFQCLPHAGLSSLKVQTQRFLLLCLLSTVSGFKLVLSTLINLLSYFTKMQCTLRVTNISEPSHFTAPWVRSQQLRRSPFSLPKGDRILDNL